MKLITLFQTEEALVKACQKGDPKAQRRVYEKYSPKMLGICFRYVHDEFEAEEIMIEGFVKVFDKINSFKLEGSFEGWIRRIMVNESLMYLRSNKKAQFEVSYDQILYEPEPEQFRTDLETKDLLKLIEKLPTGYKTVFNLYAIEGYSHAEIAEQLGITESTSKSQLSRARVILQNAVVQTI
ncbi:sigma-70 family RNA polymerase sigma factor [Arcicella aquatica]|uniref:Sigma-70 family RNA polymerase sigma factor n=1 Tax=Arcicella aquatica TaxID=217141 RepID=A0ABU5QM15_9BACT|nr:sigma-70 family RNA polymerase sigma factor [Arcicella aquatica]MEA5258105.1 sigma-70 family RNA polymerase sigma factor [Arcicella aquatica]